MDISKVPNVNYDSTADAFRRLLRVMDELRECCPWDREQTLETLRTLTIEEVYELGDAIISGDLKGLKGELGDLLLHIVFYARIGREQAQFDMESVITQLCEKLIRRHPHIYGETKVDGTKDVLANWEAIKLKEGNKSVLGGVPASLPALVKAYRIQQKAKGVGFDWPDAGGAMAKIREEISELEEAAASGDIQHLEEEFGDLMFALVNYSRHLGLNPEDALEKANRKFIRRFQQMEQTAAGKQQELRNLTLDELEALWQLAKQAPIQPTTEA